MGEEATSARAGRRAPPRAATTIAALAAVVVALGAAPADAAQRYLGFNEDAVGGMHQVSPDQYAGLVRAMGGNAIRTNLDWRLAEPRLDRWSEHWWSRWQELYDVALARGVRPIFIIGFAPPWARELGISCAGRPAGPLLAHEPGFGTCELPPRPQMNVEWAEYAAEVARRFPRATIEVWNEPNTDDYWRPAPDPARYAELLFLAYQAIKAVSPRTPVVSGGLLNVRRSDPLKGEMSARDFLAAAYAAAPSLEDSADYIGLHPYPVGAFVGPRTRFRRALADVRAVRGANGDATPILVTETGVSRADLILAPERRQAAALKRAHRWLTAQPDVAGVLYHRVVEPRDTSTNPREHGFAWLRYGDSPLEPRAVFCRFVAAAGRNYPACRWTTGTRSTTPRSSEARP